MTWTNILNTLPTKYKFWLFKQKQTNKKVSALFDSLPTDSYRNQSCNLSWLVGELNTCSFLHTVHTFEQITDKTELTQHSGFFLFTVEINSTFGINTVFLYITLCPCMQNDDTFNWMVSITTSEICKALNVTNWYLVEERVRRKETFITREPELQLKWSQLTKSLQWFQVQRYPQHNISCSVFDGSYSV